jgi:hypothetical protein
MTAQAIALPEKLLVQLQELPTERIQQVADFVEFLNKKYAQSQPNKRAIGQPRILGLHSGMGWMSQDFNDPLPDEFWTETQ